MTIRLRLPKRAIVKSSDVIQKLCRHGRAYVSRYLVLYVCPQEAPGAETCVGFAAGKKLGGATVRNRLKRVMREAFRQQRPSVKDGLLLLMMARRDAVTDNAGSAAMAGAFATLADKAKILRKS